MPGPTLHTVSRRSLRTAAQRRRRRTLSHRSVDAGADMVLAHPHVIQGIETNAKRLIAYSLGDFVFDHYSRKTGESFILNAEMGPSGMANIKVTRHGTTVIIAGDTATVKQ